MPNAKHHEITVYMSIPIQNFFRGGVIGIILIEKMNEPLIAATEFISRLI